MADKLTQYRIKDTVTGKTFTIEGPEGASDEELNSFIESTPYEDTTSEPPSPYLEGTDQPNAPVEDIPQPQGRVSMQNEVTSPAARQGVDTYISNSSGQGADPRWMTPDQESQYIAMLNDPNRTYEDIQGVLGEWAKTAGVPAMGVAGGPKGLADYRAPLRPGERRSNTVTYKNFVEDLPDAGPTVSDVDTNPMTGTQGKLISLAERGFQDAAQYGVAGWAARTYHDWMDTGMEALQQKFPGLTSEEYEDIQTQAVAYVQKTARAANTEVMEDDPMLPWLVGQFIGSASPEDIFPMIKGEKLIARLSGAAGVNAASDAAWQGVDIAQGVQDKFDPLQVVAAAGIGAGLHGAIEGGAALSRSIASTKRIEAARVSPVTYDGAGPVSVLLEAPVKNGRSKSAREAHRDYNFSVGEAAATHINNTVADWKNAPEFEVHPNFEAIDGIDKNAVAAIDPDGKVKVNLKAVLRDAKRASVSPEDVLTAMTYHESLGHHGLATLFGTRLDTMMRSFYDNGTEEFKTQVNDWMEANPKSKLGQSDWIALATEEVLAEASEAGKLTPAVADRVKNMVKGFGRKMGVDLSYSPREVKTILGMAHDATVNGRKGDISGNGFKYMYAGAGAKDRPDFKDTKWFRGPDGGWRWEMDDSKATLDEGLMSDMITDEWKEMYKNNDDVILSDVLDHPELFENYPQLQDIKITRQPAFFDIWQSIQGGYNDKTNTINITPYAKRDPLSIILHEVQHAIQDVEGFAIGGSKKTAVGKMSDKKTIEVGERYHEWFKKEAERKITEINAILEFAESPLASEWVEASKVSNEAYAALKGIPASDLKNPLNLEWSARRKDVRDIEEKVLATYGFDMKTVFENKALWNEWYNLQAVFTHGDLDKIGEKLDKMHDEAKAADTKLSVLEEALDDRDVDTIREILKGDNNVSFQAYEHLFGEVEARDVEKRMKLSKEERMFVEPYTLEKTNEPNDYIFDFGNDEEASLSFSDKNDDAAMRKYRPDWDRAKYIAEWTIMTGPKAKLMRSFRDPTKPKLGGAKFDLADDTRVTPEEMVDIDSARKIIDGVLDEYIPQGTETFDEQKRAGKALGLTSKQINNASKKGVNELSKRIFAAAQIAEKTNNTLADLSEKIGSAYVKDASQYASLKDRYIRTTLEYNALMGTLFDMNSEAGRALGAIRAIDYTYKKFGALSDTLKDFDQHNILSGFADDETFMKYVQTISAMQQQGNVKGLTVAQRSIVKPYWWQYLLTFRHSMMLSGLGTHAKNAVDNTLMVVRELEEQGLAMAAFPIRKGLRAIGMKNVDEGVSPQEAAGRLYGILSALADSETYRVTGKSYIEGTDGKTISTKTEMSDAHIPIIGKISTDALHASDVFFRALNDNANLYTLGVRSARKNGYTGMAAFTEGSSRAHTPTLEMIQESKRMTNVTLLVDAPSLLGSLVEGGKAIRPNMNAGQQAGAFAANFMLPFFRVSDRLLFQKLRRSPLAFLDRVTLEDIKAGGSRRDIAIARAVIGTYLIGQYWAAAGDNKVEGEADMPYAKQEALEGAGYMPNSVVTDEQMTDASALNLSLFPSDLQNATAANVASIRKAWDEGQSDEGSTIDALGTAAIALGSIIASSSFAENLSTYIDPFIEKDSASKGRAGANLAANVAGQFLPAAGRQIRNEIDENVRNTTGDGGSMDRVKGRLQNAIPGMSDELPQKYDVYGDEMKTGKSLLGMDNVVKRDQDAVGKELGRLERTTDKTVVSGAPKSISITSLVSDDFTSDTKYGKVAEGEVKLSGVGKEEWKKIQGKNLRTIMSAVMESQSWSTADDKTKVAIVKEARGAAYDATKTEMFPLLGIPIEEEE